MKDCTLTPINDREGYCPVCDPDRLQPVPLGARRNCRPFAVESLPVGCGTELKRLLKMAGITARGNCKCEKRAQLMDQNGPDWCESNLELIVDWLQEESRRRFIPFLRPAARFLVRRAIKNTRRKLKVLAR